MLHGQIMVNREMIGYWSAKRTGLSRLNGSCEYKVLVTMDVATDCKDQDCGKCEGCTGKERAEQTTHLWHDPKDGALALAAAVLAAVSPGPGMRNRGGLVGG